MMEAFTVDFFQRLHVRGMQNKKKRMMFKLYRGFHNIYAYYNLNFGHMIK